MKTLLLTLLILTSTAWAEPVCSAHDGDTLKLCSGQSVRLFGVDAPELKQPMGKEARDYMRKLVIGQDVALDCGSKSYTRAVCRVTVRGLDLSREMAGRGFAYDSPRYSKGAFAGAESFARKEGRGVWSLPDGGVRPWVYRHR